MAPSITIVALLAALLPLTHAQESPLQCGSTPYFPSQYTCHNNTILCPISYSLTTVPCAGSCYAPQTYSCPNEQLQALPKASSPFTLTAYGVRQTYVGQALKACGGYLAIGANARECTSCPAGKDGVDCKSYGRKTVLEPEGRMAVDVPGGQYWFVNPQDGALQYTDAPKVKNGTVGWNATATEEVWGKEWAGQRVTVLENGFFEYESSAHYWFACLRTLPGGTVGTGRTWRIYSSSPSNVEFSDCEKIKLVATAVDRKKGAYKYDE